MMAYDKNRIPIKLGDVLKVYHFKDGRGKRHYMYKHIVNFGHFSDGQKYWIVSHLDLDRDNHYYLICDDSVYADSEIIQSVECDHEDRERKVK